MAVSTVRAVVEFRETFTFVTFDHIDFEETHDWEPPHLLSSLFPKSSNLV
jgi:hypothetical protein